MTAAGANGPPMPAVTEADVAPVRLLICRTCPRYLPTPAGQPTDGVRLAAAMRRMLKEQAAPAGLEVRAVNCLAGCRNPCNVALDGPGRYRLRFSRLAETDLPALLAVARRYAASPDGNLPDEAIEDGLADRLTARSPARIGD